MTGDMFDDPGIRATSEFMEWRNNFSNVLSENPRIVRSLMDSLNVALEDAEADQAYRRIRARQAAEQRVRDEDRVRRKPIADLILTPEQADALPDLEPLVVGTIDVGGFALFYGEGGSGKTFVGLDLSCCVSLGLPWHGRPTRRTKVLYVAAEGGRGVRRRRRAWERRYGQSNVDMYAEPVNLLDPEDVAQLVDVIEDKGYGLIVFDTYNKVTPGLNENDANGSAGTAVVLAAIEKFRTAGATVLVIHHTTKGGDRPRGSAALEWASDHGFLVEKDGASVNVIEKRQKDREIDNRPMVLTLVGEPDTGSAFLVDGDPTAADRPDLTNGAATVPAEHAYDVFARVTTGFEQRADLSPAVAILVDSLAQLMAQRSARGSVGVSRAEAASLLGRGTKDGTIRRAWDELWTSGALTPAAGSRTPTGRCWWVEPGDGREAELTNRELSG